MSQKAGTLEPFFPSINYALFQSVQFWYKIGFASSLRFQRPSANNLPNSTQKVPKKRYLRNGLQMCFFRKYSFVSLCMKQVRCCFFDREASLTRS